MGYGITNTSQIIDLETIVAGCNELKNACEDFKKSGTTVVQAGEMCNEKALSFDENTLEFSITQLGEEMKELQKLFSEYADQVIAEATRIHNIQTAEYEEYVTQQEALSKQNETNTMN